MADEEDEAVYPWECLTDGTDTAGATGEDGSNAADGSAGGGRSESRPAALTPQEWACPDLRVALALLRRDPDDRATISECMRMIEASVSWPSSTALPDTSLLSASLPSWSVGASRPGTVAPPNVRMPRGSTLAASLPGAPLPGTEVYGGSTLPANAVPPSSPPPSPSGAERAGTSPPRVSRELPPSQSMVGASPPRHATVADATQPDGPTPGIGPRSTAPQSVSLPGVSSHYGAPAGGPPLRAATLGGLSPLAASPLRPVPSAEMTPIAPPSARLRSASPPSTSRRSDSLRSELK